MKEKYDVFISSKSDDYPIAIEIYNFLTQNGFSVFLACKELEKIGEAEFSDAIGQALDTTSHMIVVASKLQHVNSRWVHYEWGTFRSDLNSGYRNGNLITVLNNVSHKDLPAGLRHQQSFSFSSYKNGLLGYLKHEEKKNSIELSAEEYYLQAKKEYKSQNYSEALRLFTIAAKKGHTRAQYNIGVMYSKGQGTPIDASEALKWFKEAANNGDANAQLSVSIRYEQGIGTIQNTSEAIKWIRLAAENGLSKAQCSLANKFYYGNGVRRNYQAAYKWYTKSAEQGNMEALRMVANMSEYGVGVASNYKTALYWYEKLAVKGDKYAKEKLLELKTKRF